MTISVRRHVQYQMPDELLRQIYAQPDLPKIEFSVSEIPKSLNHQYRRGRTPSQMFIAPEIRQFRELVAWTLHKQRHEVFRAPVSVIIAFESALWVTKANTVRKIDLDNKVKAVLDAVAHALDNFDDCLVWDLSVHKVAAEAECTTVWMFEKTDIVPFKACK